MIQFVLFVSGKYFMLSTRAGLIEDNQKARSSYNQITTLMPRENNQQQDGLITSSLKAVGLLDASATWDVEDHSPEKRAKRQLEYSENAHLISEGQDGFITKYLKKNGYLDWRSKYEGWCTWSVAKMGVSSVTQQTEDNGRTVTTFLSADDSDGEMKVRQCLQLIDETAVLQPKDANESQVEILEDDEEVVSTALTIK